MRNGQAIQHEKYPDAFHDAYSRTTFGFWLYLLSDFILFGTLFATYAVLHNSTYGGPSSRELFNIPFSHYQTLILLVCSLTAGLAGASAHRRDTKRTIIFFVVTFVLGLVFVGMQLDEFIRFVNAGHGWQKSAFLSAYFTVVGTHMIHMVFALLWVIIFVFPLFYQGITPVSIRRLTCLKMFWQFLNIIWIFIFSFVYLMGVY